MKRVLSWMGEIGRSTSTVDRPPRLPTTCNGLAPKRGSPGARRAFRRGQRGGHRAPLQAAAHGRAWARRLRTFVIALVVESPSPSASVEIERPTRSRPRHHRLRAARRLPASGGGAQQRIFVWMARK
jgi:hypothetical protein